MSTKGLRDNKGVSLILFAIALIVICGFAALAIDIGHLYHVKDQLQVAADAAALAGAGELTGGSDATKTANAKLAAARLAKKNTADQLPVILTTSTDVEVGNWDNTKTPNFKAGRTPLNAVRVFALRTGANTDQPKASNWFARVFALLNRNYDLSSIDAVAIATKTPLQILPIAVNEYWNETVRNCVPLPGGAYGQAYPQSFMRSIDADGNSANALGGWTFAVLGTAANSNDASFNLNSFVDIMHRNRFHTPIISSTLLSNSDEPGPTAWWLVNQGTSTGTCSTCAANLTELPGGVTNGDVNPGKFGQNFGFLFTGIPGNIIPPNAVREVVRPTPCYPGDNYNNTDTFNNPSNCPFASIPYFSSSGNIVQQSGPTGNNFKQQWPKGSKFMVMVYDGTLTANPNPSQANVVTIIGYGIIEVDGYASKNPAQIGLQAGNTSAAYTFNKSILSATQGDTAYGHALKHNVSGQTDAYLIQPPDSPANSTTASARKGICSFTDLLTAARNNFANLSLVGVSPDVRYGTKD